MLKLGHEENNKKFIKDIQSMNDNSKQKSFMIKKNTK